MRGTARRVDLELAGEVVDLALAAAAARSWRPPAAAASGSRDRRAPRSRAPASARAGRAGSGARRAPGARCCAWLAQDLDLALQGLLRARGTARARWPRPRAHRPAPRAASAIARALDLGAQPAERAEQREVALRGSRAGRSPRARCRSAAGPRPARRPRPRAPGSRRRCRPPGSAPPAPGWTGSPCRRRA